jgi:peptide/nickel transport system ATP-binding protein
MSFFIFNRLIGKKLRYTRFVGKNYLYLWIMSLLQVENLSIEFITGAGIIRAVDNLSFSLDTGETIGIVGESGSGKTVASLAIMGLLPVPPVKAAEGRILFTENGQNVIDIATLKEDEFRKIRGNKISMIFQEPMTSLNPVIRCGKQVVEIITEHTQLSKKEAKNKTLKLFDEVLLPRPKEMFNAYPHQLSGGQKQRVMIAMAMACNPSILIADEPTTALDVTVQKSILELMKKLQKDYGTAIIFITHDLGVVSGLADRLLVMQSGSLVEEGLTSDLFHLPKHPYTQGLMACRPSLEKDLRRLPMVEDFINHQNGASDLVSFIKSFEKVKEEKSQSTFYNENPLLELKHVTTEFYGKKSGFRGKKSVIRAVDNVSFDVYPGETIGLVGESGCGKTTLGRTILRLVDSAGGEIFYRGTDLVELSLMKMKKRRKNMQVIFQDPYSSLNPRLSAGEAIVEPMTVHGLHKNRKERKRVAIELLQKVGLEKVHYNRYPHEFSGGQRQRICIARALAVEPEFIICDESVSALDVSVQAQVLNLLNDLKEEFGFTYIFISHDLSVIKHMSDRVFVMKDGKIIESGSAKEIYDNPQNKYTQKLIEAIPKINS